MRRVGPAEGVLDPDLTPPEVVADPSEQGVEAVPVERLVDLAPVDLGLDRRLADDELVLRRPPGVRPGEEDDRPRVGQGPFPPDDRLLRQDGRCEVRVRGGPPGPVARHRPTVAVAVPGHQNAPFRRHESGPRRPAVAPPPSPFAPLRPASVVPSPASIRQGRPGNGVGTVFTTPRPHLPRRRPGPHAPGRPAREGRSPRGPRAGRPGVARR